MKVGLVGSGAREHALATALARSADVVVFPGNPGMAGRSPEGFQISTSDRDPAEMDVDLVVVGPEVPLVEGLADRLRARGIPVFGPGADGARLEGSKAYMKELAARAEVPTARFGVFAEPAAAEQFLRALPGPYVVKTDGLAAGKGVLVTGDLSEAIADVGSKLSGDAFGAAGRTVVVEEALSGPEVSLFVLCSGTDAAVLPPAQDYKRIGDGDRGPNTGGMGAYSPVPAAGPAVVDEIMESIVHPTLRQLAREGVDYRGLLYAGCMLTESGPQLLEYNVRFGDPEAEVVVPRLGGDFAQLCLDVALGKPIAVPPVVHDAAACVVMAAAGYPGPVRTGDEIMGLEAAQSLPGVAIFHGATALDANGRVCSAGGRVLTVSATGCDLEQARTRMYEAVRRISFRGAHFRSDIARTSTLPDRTS